MLEITLSCYHVLRCHNLNTCCFRMFTVSVIVWKNKVTTNGLVSEHTSTTGRFSRHKISFWLKFGPQYASHFKLSVSLNKLLQTLTYLGNVLLPKELRDRAYIIYNAIVISPTYYQNISICCSPRLGVSILELTAITCDIRLLLKSCHNAAIHVHTIHINENERR